MRDAHIRALLLDRGRANLLLGGGVTEHLNNSDRRPTGTRLVREEGGL